MSLDKKITRAALLALPVRPRNITSVYKEILLVPTGKKHYSGYAVIAIVGVSGSEAEIAGYSDHIQWKTTKTINTDALFPSGILRFFTYGGKFHVGPSHSSTEIEVKS